MFTVLIAEKSYIDAIRTDDKLFFEPFLNNKDLAFCYWNTKGQTLKEAVPELQDIVGKKKEWRAIIINNLSEEIARLRNPFDVVNHESLDELVEPDYNIEESETKEKLLSLWKEYYENLAKEKENVYKNAIALPLTKLSTWLCFKPTEFIKNDYKGKVDETDLVLEEIYKENNGKSLDDEIQKLRKTYYTQEMRLKEQLRSAFIDEKYLNINYPIHVLCITPRVVEKDFFNPEDYWNTDLGKQYSQFVDRNMYFDKMRFLVYDALPYSHKDFRSNYIFFLTICLIVATNPISSSSIQSRHLYRIDVETDDGPLYKLITTYDKKLANTYESINSEIEKTRSEIPGSLSDKDASLHFCTPSDIPVVLDNSCKEENTYVEKDYGLFYDSPENEHSKWKKDYNASKEELAYISKQQLRSIKKSIVQANIASQGISSDISRLTQFQIDDIREFAEKEENKMIESIPDNYVALSSYQKKIENSSENIKKKINTRMTKKSGIILTIIVFALYLIGFLPFIISSNAGYDTTSIALIITLVSLGLLLVILLISLLLMRSSLISLIKDYNNTVNDVLSNIKSFLRQCSEYLSASCSVRRSNNVLQNTEKVVDEYTQSINVLKKHQEEIRKVRAKLKESYKDYIGDITDCDENLIEPFNYDFTQIHEYTYPAPIRNFDSLRIEFVDRGNFVDVPTNIILSIIARKEEIYENN